MQRFESLAVADLSAADARTIVGRLPRTLDEPTAHRLFSALRAWTWKALDQKRRDPELREWHDVITRAQVRTRSLAIVAGQFQVLLDLIHESVAVAERRPVEDVLHRRHVRQMLVLLGAAPGGHLRKAEIMRKLGLKQANLTRLMNVVIGAGLVERIVDGREARFRLSKAGEQQLERLAGRGGDRETLIAGSSNEEASAHEIEGVLLEIVSQPAEEITAMLAALPHDFERRVTAGEVVRICAKVGAAQYRGETGFGDPRRATNIAQSGRSNRSSGFAYGGPKFAAASHD